MGKNPTLSACCLRKAAHKISPFPSGGNSAFWPVLVSIEKSSSEKPTETHPAEIYSPHSSLLCQQRDRWLAQSSGSHIQAALPAAFPGSRGVPGSHPSSILLLTGPRAAAACAERSCGRHKGVSPSSSSLGPSSEGWAREARV